MIQRTIGVALGALATYLLLVILVPDTGDRSSAYVTAVVVGAVVSWAWPVVIAFWLGRRAKERREDQIEKEVQRQLDEERSRQG
ncbi:MAG TPA: hypothetical protein VJZ72_10565 [Candidatus Limnocylindrales bacterium]|nr:hypothetical protein [Candidatus Limnocylindrales bacterium]